MAVVAMAMAVIRIYHLFFSSFIFVDSVKLFNFDANEAKMTTEKKGSKNKMK